ncbi:hypothetical protein H4R34_004074 [Dimargaris verticillata]|uniref:Uncharacterized protein n=1 Tax=Dimargaris verticillata TaxID=2761393 RepID=A0A9W8EC12_9FUNG|nr:hypothetical protein H4R34_004074 [Dimargaris verticillata]
MALKIRPEVTMANTLMVKLAKSAQMFMQEQTTRGRVIDVQTRFLTDSQASGSVIDSSSAKPTVTQSDSLKSMTFRFTVTDEDVNRQGEMDDASLSRLNSDVATLVKIAFSGSRMVNAGAATTMSTRIQRYPVVGDTIDLVCTIVGHNGPFIYLHTEVYLVDPTAPIEQSRQKLMGVMDMTKFTPLSPPPPPSSSAPCRSKL